jgi:hypothetical protein
MFTNFAYIYTTRLYVVAEQWLGSKPSQTTPQHARKENILHFSYDRAGSAYLHLWRVVPHPTWDRTLLRSRITLIFSTALTFMAPVRENRSFGSLV